MCEDRIEVINGRIGCQQGVSNRFATYPATVTRGTKTVNEFILCPDCHQQVKFRIQSTTWWKIWQGVMAIAIGIAVIGGIVAWMDIFNYSEFTEGLAVAAFFTVGIAGLFARVVGAAVIQNKGIRSSYGNHVFVVDSVNFTTKEAWEAESR